MWKEDTGDIEDVVIVEKEMKVFEKSGFVWEKCPYLLWIFWSLCKIFLYFPKVLWIVLLCMIFGLLPLNAFNTVLHILESFYVSVSCRDGQAEKKIKEIWKKHEFNYMLVFQVIFMIGIVLLSIAGWHWETFAFNSDNIGPYETYLVLGIILGLPAGLFLIFVSLYFYSSRHSIRDIIDGGSNLPANQFSDLF